MDLNELQNYDEFIKIFLGLLALANPFGAIPFFLSATENFTRNERLLVIRDSTLTLIVTLVVFIFTGAFILDLFGITSAAFRIAGGLMFLFYALELLGLIAFPESEKMVVKENPRGIGIVPLGIPLLAGPGAISQIVLYSGLHESMEHKILVAFAVLSAAVVNYIVLRTTCAMGKGISPTTILIMNKIFGLLLAAIAVEFILDGVTAHFPDIVAID
jgi:multiple antibiotic resistance protein